MKLGLLLEDATLNLKLGLLLEDATLNLTYIHMYIFNNVGHQLRNSNQLAHIKQIIKIFHKK